MSRGQLLTVFAKRSVNQLIIKYFYISPITWVLFLGYLCILCFFSFVDVYHQKFFTSGKLVIIYNIARISFIFYLTCLFYVVGDWCLSCWVGRAYKDSMTLEAALLGFFVGFGVWHLVLFFLGFCGVYHHFLLSFITTLLFFLTLPRLDNWIQFGKKAQLNFYKPGLCLLILAAILFLITKGLYPSGGHDYFNHYFHFYRSVVDSGNTLPNSVWYHFYYSKGGALFFLSMVLTDPLAPQLATTSMVFAGAAIIFCLFRDSPSKWMPYVGAALYILGLIYTPGPAENLGHGGWGDLEKLHEPASVLMLAIIWMLTCLAKTSQPQRWGIALIFSITAQIIIEPTLFIISGPYLSLSLIYFIVVKNKQAVFWTSISLLTAGIVILIIGLSNYLLTGIPNDQGLLFFWPIINFKKVEQLGTAIELLNLHCGRMGQYAQRNPYSYELLFRIMTYLRLDVWGIFFSLSFLLFITRWILSIKYKTHQLILSKAPFLACVSFLMLVAFISLFISRDQPVSFYRFSTFSYAPMLCVVLLMCSAISLRFIPILLLSFASAGIGYYGVPYIYKTLEQRSPRLVEIGHRVLGKYKIKSVKHVLENGINFTTGKYSLADAYKNQQGMPGRYSYGAIHPAIEAVWHQLPSKTRIWSVHTSTYGMLPDCHMEGIHSFQLTQDPSAVYFGTAETEKEAFKREGLNYFFISKIDGIEDWLILQTPLFSPEQIAEHLGIAWTDGNSYLLTWKENATRLLDADWVEDYSKLTANLREIFAQHYINLAVEFNKKIVRAKI